MTVSGTLKIHRGRPRAGSYRCASEGGGCATAAAACREAGRARRILFQAPSNTGEVSLVAFVDVDEDGPSPTDPAGRADIEIAEETLADLRIDLSDEPELGDLTP